jgi:outer membrane protein, heavy metal efflux system
VAVSPAVRAAETRIAVAESHAEYAAMPTPRNPIVGVRALFGYPDDAAATYAFFVGIPFDLTSRRSLRSTEADLLVDEAEGQLDLERMEARARAMAAAARVAAGQDSVRIAEARFVLARGLLEATRRRMEAGAATVLDLALVEQEAATASANMAARQRELEAARDALRAVLDLSPTDSVVVASMPPATIPRGLTLERAVARAKDQRREPHVWRLWARRLRVSEDRLYAESIAPPIFSAEYEVQTNSQRLASFGVGVTTELPLFWTAQGDRAVARSEAISADVSSELALRAASREAAAAWRLLKTTLNELRGVEEEAIPTGERALALTEQLLEAGAAEVFRVLLARNALFELRARQVDLWLTAWLARAELERAIGGYIR